MYRYKRRKGSAISEFGPALFILFLVVLFPLIDILGLALSYGICWYLNFKICNQVARTKEANGPTIAASEVSVVQATGFANFLHIQQINVPNPSYQDSATPPTVKVQTSVTAMPFVPVPWFTSVAGLNAPVTFTISSTVVRELTL